MRESKFEIKKPIAPTIDDMHKALCGREDAEAVDPNQFRDLYGAANVEADLKYVKEMEERFLKERNPQLEGARQLAEIFEAIICEQAELSDWLGSDAFTSRTSRYDDIKNGVDVVAEFQETETAASHLALATDVMVGRGLYKKLGRIKQEIVRGKLTRIKYFISEAMNIRGELSQIPRVIIGAEAKTVAELGRLRLAGDNKALAKHPIQFQILEGIALQLDAFSEYARKIKRDDIAKIYEHMSKLIQNIRIKKLSGMKDTGWRDMVFLDLKDKLKHLENI